MQYRKFEKANKEISLLGVGTMRFPKNPDDSVNEAESISMIRAAIDAGVNYVDTAYMYHNGTSENIVGKALKDGYRQKVFLADKMPVWLAKDEDEMKAMFYEQLKRLDTDCIEMYLVHNITESIWRRAKRFNTMQFLEQMREEGKIKYIGFSFHDELTFFKEVVDEYPWDFCQIQLNYMDANYQAGVEGLKYAGKKGLPVIIMEPLKGGKLIDIIPKTVNELWESAEIKRSPVEWALRWVADFPEVLTILSGMSSMEQIKENLRILSDATPDSLDATEKKIIEKVSNEYNKLIKYSCTACKYCQPCPQKIEIHTAIGLYNDWFLYDHNPKSKNDYYMWLDPGKRAGDCIGCKACEDHCPQHLPISEIMKKAAEIYE